MTSHQLRLLSIVTTVMTLTGCGLTSDLKNPFLEGQDFARETVSGAVDLSRDLAKPVLDAAAEAQRRIEQVEEGIEGIQQGAAKIKGSLTASGITF